MMNIYRYFKREIQDWRVQILVMFALLARRDRWLLRWLGDPMAGRIRSQFPIHAFIGPNGSGKTLTMVKQAQRALDKGRKVISTVPLYLDKEAGILHPNYVPLDNWEVLRDARNCHILIDEISTVINSRDTTPLPFEIEGIFNQLRKRKCIVLWSSPSFNDAKVQIRGITRAVTYCDGTWPDERAYRAGLASDDSEFDEGWIPNRLFHVQTFSKTNVPEWAIENPGPRVAEERYWGPGSPAFNTYDTNSENVRLGQANDYGLCIVCEGTRRRDECTCADYQSRVEIRRAARGPVTRRNTSATRSAAHAH